MILSLKCTAAFIMCHVFPVIQDGTHCWLNAKKLMQVKHLNAFLTGKLDVRMPFILPRMRFCFGGEVVSREVALFLTNILCL